MNSARITLKHIRAFREVAHHHHFTRAAEALAMSQPALSALVAQLEEDLGIKLFERTTRSVELTSAGREFLKSAERILVDVDTAIRETREQALLRRGRLRIAALPSLSTTLLPELARRFMGTFKGISISIIDVQGDDIVSLVASRQVDFGLGYVPASDATVAEPILSDRLEAVASRRLFDKPPAQMTWKNLENFDIIAMSHGTTIRRLVDDAARRSDADLRITLQPHQIPTAVAYAAAGLGVAILPTLGIPRGLSRSTLRIKLIKPIVERPLSIIRAPLSSDSPVAAAFLDLLKRQTALLRVAESPNRPPDRSKRGGTAA